MVPVSKWCPWNCVMQEFHGFSWRHWTAPLYWKIKFISFIQRDPGNISKALLLHGGTGQATLNYFCSYTEDSGILLSNAGLTHDSQMTAVS